MIQSIKLCTAGILASALLAAGCGTTSGNSFEEKTRGWSAEKLYNTASGELSSYDFDEAAKYLERLDAQHPNSAFAQQALLDLAYSYYQDQSTDLAIATAERFINNYPRHKNVDYAYYIRGIANYDRGFGFITKIFPPNEFKTDQTNALQTFRYFSELVQRFPNSRYAKDATQRMQFIRNNLAKYEAVVGNYYLERQSYVAAVNRGKAVLQNFQTTPAAKAALAVMVEAYAQMGMRELAQVSMDTLAKNFSRDPFTTRSASVMAGKPVKSMKKMIENL